MNLSELLIANWPLLLFTLATFALVMLLMAVGVLFSNRCLRGSCGGPEVLGPNGESLACDNCPLHRKRKGPRRGRRPLVSGERLTRTSGGIP